MGKAVIRPRQGFGGHVLPKRSLDETRGLSAEASAKAEKNAALNIMSCPVGYDLIKICTEES